MSDAAAAPACGGDAAAAAAGASANEKGRSVADTALLLTPPGAAADAAAPEPPPASPETAGVERRRRPRVKPLPLRHQRADHRLPFFQQLCRRRAPLPPPPVPCADSTSSGGGAGDAAAPTPPVVARRAFRAPRCATTPKFMRASPRLDDAREMVEELRRCGWLREGYLEEGPAAAVILFCEEAHGDSAGTAGGLRLLVVHARAGTLESWGETHLLSLCRLARLAARDEGACAVAADQAAAAAKAAATGTTPQRVPLRLCCADDVAAALASLRMHRLPAQCGLTPRVAAALVRWSPHGAMRSALRLLPAALVAHPRCTLFSLAAGLALLEKQNMTAPPPPPSPAPDEESAARQRVALRLPLGVSPPRFAVPCRAAGGETPADVAAMVAELRRCGWVSASSRRVKRRSVDVFLACSSDASVADLAPRAAAAALRALVARVLRERLPPSAWDDALHAAAVAAREEAHVSGAAAAGGGAQQKAATKGKQGQGKKGHAAAATAVAARAAGPPRQPHATWAVAEAGGASASASARQQQQQQRQQQSYRADDAAPLQLPLELY
jgi:hypothetical protein